MMDTMMEPTESDAMETATAGAATTRASKHGRHAAPRPKHRRWPWILAGVILLLIILACVFWFLPPDMVPVAKTVDECTVSTGGTLTIGTYDCGTFYYRGHVDVWKDTVYQVEHSGPVAWSFTMVE